MMETMARICGGDAGAAADGGAPRDRIGEIIQHSEDVVQILGVPPHWLARTGSLAILGAVALLIGLAHGVHYPDVVNGAVVIGAKLPPATVVSQASGNLENLTVRDGDRVASGQMLARIATSASPAAVARLEELLAGWDDGHLPSLSTINEIDTLPLGELRMDFASFKRAHAAYDWYRATNPTASIVRALEAERQPLQDRLDSLERQRSIASNEIEIAERSFNRLGELARQHDVSLVTLEDHERTVLTAKRALEAISVEAANTRLDLSHIDLDLVNATTRDEQQREDLQDALHEAVKTMSGKLALWERTYVLRAPLDGAVSLSTFSTESHFVKAGEEVMAIVPAGQQAFVGRILLPINRAGSVRVGQTAYVQLENYPAERFGMLKGIVSSISPVPLSSHFAVTMDLPNGLVTTFGHELLRQQEMQGTAEIVIEDLRVIDRIFYQFRKAIFNITQ
jgi:multidrug resistance efflux pump